VKESFYEVLERTIHKFHKYLNTEVGKEEIFKPTIGNKSIHEISDDNGVRVVNFATSKNLSQKYNVPTSQHS
jgi:hypothetical protein